MQLCNIYTYYKRFFHNIIEFQDRISSCQRTIRDIFIKLIQSNLFYAYFYSSIVYLVYLLTINDPESSSCKQNGIINANYTHRGTSNSSFTLTHRTYDTKHDRKSRAGNTEYLPLIWRILQHDGDRIPPPTLPPYRRCRCLRWSAEVLKPDRCT